MELRSFLCFGLGAWVCVWDWDNTISYHSGYFWNTVGLNKNTQFLNRKANLILLKLREYKNKSPIGQVDKFGTVK